LNPGIINKTPLFKNRNYIEKKSKLKRLHEEYKNNPHTLLFGKESATGYPINEIMHGLAYLIAAQAGNLNGTRPRGNLNDIIETALSGSPEIEFIFKVPDLLTPLVILGKTHAVLIGARNPPVYKKLIRFDTKNPYKIIVRDIDEKDL
jgi:hypothetical protein